MTTIAYATRDSATMLRRNLLHMRRYPSMTLLLAGMPVIFLLLFVYVFGGTLGAGLGDPGGGRAEYLNYVVPGILLMAVASAANGTAVSVATDMTEGIVARFRTMAIARVSVLTGHVLGAMIQTMISVLIVLGVAVAIGFRPQTDLLGWLGAFGVLCHDHLRADLAVRGVGPGQRQRRDGQQPAHAAGAPAVPQQRVRAHRVDAGRAAAVRRVPAVHADHRVAAGAAQRHVAGRRPGRVGGLVRRASHWSATSGRSGCTTASPATDHRQTLSAGRVRFRPAPRCLRQALRRTGGPAERKDDTVPAATAAHRRRLHAWLDLTGS